MKTLHLILLLTINISVFSQGEANIWYFGSGAGVDFSSGKPVALKNGRIFTVEGCASISTNKGRLLFYSDGYRVFDSTHKLMPNGSGLKGSNTSTQSAIIVQKPGSSNIYYLFTVEPNYGENGYSYSEIDMELNGGKGDIIPDKKNIRLFVPSTEKLCATMHKNGKDIWVVTLKAASDTIYSYLITSNGINLNPVKSKTGLKIVGIPYLDNIGQLKIAHNGKKIAFVNYGCDTSVIGDFNASTGKISNVWLFAIKYAYGLEFSSKGNFLYISQGDYNFNPYHSINKLWQYNLKATTNKSFITSKKLIEGYYNDSGATEIGSLQLGVDGKIYISLAYSPYLGVIHAPDSLGSICRLQKRYVNLGKGFCYYGLPNFTKLYLPKIKFEINGNCINNNFHFAISDTEELDSVKWDFGDPKSDTNNYSKKMSDVSHSYQNFGDYEISLIAYYNNYTDTIKSLISFEKPKADFTVSDICEGKDAFFINKSSKLFGKVDYKWKFGDGQTSTLESAQHLYKIGGVSQTFNVTFVIKTQFGCADSINKAVTINANPKSDFNYTSSNNKWNFTPSQLGNTKYRWKFGDGDSTISATASHSYKDGLSPHTVCLKATNAAKCISETCKQIATTGVSYTKPSGFKIYPNPNAGNFTIEIENPEKDISVEVYNAIGGKIKKVAMVGKVMDVNLEVVPGIYLVKVRNGEVDYYQKVSVVK